MIQNINNSNPDIADFSTSHYDKCRTLLLRHRENHMRRNVIVAVLMLINAYVSIIRAPIIHGLVALYGFFFGMGIFLYCAVIVVLGFLAIPERPKLLAVTCLLIVIGIAGSWIASYLGIPMLGLFLWQIPECKQALWIKKQPGYPHFNERFTEQMENFGKEYQPEHELDHIQDAQMPDIPETPSPDFPEFQTMPEIPDFPELTEISESPESAITKKPELVSLQKDPALQDLPDIPDSPGLPDTQDFQNFQNFQNFLESPADSGSLGTDRILMGYAENAEKY